MSRNGNGRPSRFTDDVKKKILWALKIGNYRKVAAEYAGISDRTLISWLSRGRDQMEGDPYHEFYLAVLEAEQTAEVRALGIIQQAAQKDWKAAAWYLERKFPERYCTRAAVFIAKRLALQEEPDWDMMSEKEMEAEMLRCLQGATSDIARSKLLAALDGEEVEPKVIDVGVEPQTEPSLEGSTG